MGLLSRLRLAGHPDDDQSQRELEAMRARSINYDPGSTRGLGWQREDRWQALPAGSWDAAQRLMLGYEFADPSIAHAVYDADEPLRGRTMLLELRLWAALRIDLGVRVVDVYEADVEHDGRPGHVWGWAYRTLEGHVEAGQMNWELWRFADTDEIAFRVHAHSHVAMDEGPLLPLGFRLVGRRQQARFLHQTCVRMRRLTEAALAGEDVAALAETLTLHRRVDTSAAHRRLAGRLD